MPSASSSPSPSQLEVVAPDVWATEYDVRMPGGVHFRSRMSVVRSADGGLSLLSPAPIDEALAAELSALGPVERLIAPSLYHHLHVAAAAERYPQARVFAPAALTKKRPELHIDSTLGDDAAPQLGGLEHVLIQGAPSLSEVCFFHAPSRTLFVADLVFNIHEYRGALTGLMLRAVGAHRKLAMSRSWRLITQDKARLRESLRNLLSWDFERLVVGHGRIVHEQARDALELALAHAGGPRAPHGSTA